MVKFGIVGTGPWGRKVEAAIKALRFDVECCTARGEAYKELIQRCDIVWVAAHPDVNLAIASCAMTANKPTVVEKPVALTRDDVAHLLWLSKIHRASFVVNYIHLFNEDLMRLNNKETGGFDVRMGGAGPVRDYSALWDYGSHAAAIALTFLNGPIDRIEVVTAHEKFMLYCGSRAAAIHVSNALLGRLASVHFENAVWRDDRSLNPLAVLISTMARKRLRGEYWTNGELAVEVTDLLERLHK